MSFQRSADSLKSKAHLSGVRTPVLVGLTALAVCVFALVCAGLVQAATSDGLVVLTADTADEDEAAEDETAETSAAADEESETTVFVYVSGAVNNPCVVELTEGARVIDAVEAAGGFADDAATDALNLARVVVDGEQIDVPTLEEQAAAEEAGVTLSTSSTEESASETSALININTATAEELETLPGIGEVTAANIIADREANGAFETIEDITRVSGIGDKKFEAIADLICVD